jgi:5'(3')-deoxyribonucleotidase
VTAGRRPLRVGIDIDDVLYPWFDVAHRLSERAGITNGVTPTSWKASEDYGCDDDTWYAVLAEATVSGELYDAPPFDDACHQLDRLHAGGHRIHLVTARGFMQHGDLIREHTIRWLRRWSIPHDSLTFTKDKRTVATDVFLDDAPHNYDQLLGHTEVWLLHARHNAAACEDRKTAASLKEFIDAVLIRAAR